MTLTDEEMDAVAVITTALLRHRRTASPPGTRPAETPAPRVETPPPQTFAETPSSPGDEAPVLVKEAARLLHMSENQVRAMVKRGELPHYMVGISPRFLPSKLRAYQAGDWKPPVDKPPSGTVLPMRHRGKSE